MNIYVNQLPIQSNPSMIAKARWLGQVASVGHEIVFGQPPKQVHDTCPSYEVAVEIGIHCWAESASGSASCHLGGTGTSASGTVNLSGYKGGDKVAFHAEWKVDLVSFYVDKEWRAYLPVVWIGSKRYIDANRDNGGCHGWTDEWEALTEGLLYLNSLLTNAVYRWPRLLHYRKIVTIATA